MDNLKSQKVEQVFSQVAPYYDQMNDLMTLGWHRLWKDRLVRAFPKKSGCWLDAACGTGDVALRLASYHPGGELWLLDPQPAMHAQALERLASAGQLRIDSDWKIHSLQLRAEELSEGSPACVGCTLAFGLRNFLDPKLGLSKLVGTLELGGKIGILEFCPCESFWRQPVNWYQQKLLPSLGQLWARDRESYKYLADSIQSFWTQDELRQVLEVDLKLKIESWHALGLGAVVMVIAQRVQ